MSRIEIGFTHSDLARCGTGAHKMFNSGVRANICPRSSEQISLVVGEGEPGAGVVVGLADLLVLICAEQIKPQYHEVPECEGCA